MLRTLIAEYWSGSVAELHRRVLGAGGQVTPQAVHLWVRGTGGVSRPHVRPLADALGVDAEAVALASAGLDWRPRAPVADAPRAA